MTNRLMQRAGEDALTHARPRTVWERLPVWPRIFGRMLIRSQAPTATRKFVTSSVAQPASSDIAPDVVQRFVDQHGELVAWIEQLDEQRMARTVMTSPFAAFITYTVLDGCRLV